MKKKSEEEEREKKIAELFSRNVNVSGASISERKIVPHDNRLSKYLHAVHHSLSLSSRLSSKQSMSSATQNQHSITRCHEAFLPKQCQCNTYS